MSDDWTQEFVPTMEALMEEARAAAQQASLESGASRSAKEAEAERLFLYVLTVQTTT